MSRRSVSFVTLYNPAERILGGIEQHVLALSEALARQGVRTSVITMGRTEMPIEYASKGVLYRVLPDRGVTRVALRSACFAIQGADLIEKTESDLEVDAFLGQAGFASPLLLARRERSISVLTVHTGERHNRLADQSRVTSGSGPDAAAALLAYPILRLWRHAYFRRATGLVYVSDPAKLETEEAYPLTKSIPCVTIPNGADSSSLHIRPVDRMYDLCFVGRLEPIKGVDFFVNALQRLASCYAGLRVLIVGHGSLSAYVQHELRDCIKAGTVTVLENIPHDHLIELMARSRFLVLPSRSESDPIVIHEALAVGTPVIAFDLPPLLRMYAQPRVFFAGQPNVPNLVNQIRYCLDMETDRYAGYVEALLADDASRRTWDLVATEYMQFLSSLW